MRTSPNYLPILSPLQTYSSVGAASFTPSFIYREGGMEAEAKGEGSLGEEGGVFIDRRKQR